MELPAEVERAVSSYLQLIDKRVPELLEGLYLTGSIALDDFRPNQSDIDFVAITSNTLNKYEIQEILQVHKLLLNSNNYPYFDGIYVTWKDLEKDAIGLQSPYYHDGRIDTRDRFSANPVTWYTLYKYPVSIRGPKIPKVFHDNRILREWCKSNLGEYWKKWVYSTHSNIIRFIYSYTNQGITWGVLGVVRLYATIQTGDIISKTKAADYAQITFDPKWKNIITYASNIRMEKHNIKYSNPQKRRNEALAFMEEVITKGIEL
jgi:hypothetical protein